ncbi:MAG: hypothetical protein AABX16_04110 [Nanoarchaeota archaeon]
MKPLQPAHRENKRYLLIQGSDINKEIIEDILLEFLGIFGYSDAAPHFVVVKPDEIILAINRESLNKVRASFLLCEKDIRIVMVSGSLKKVKN